MNYHPNPQDKAFSRKFGVFWVEGYETMEGIVITNIIGPWEKLFKWSSRSEKSNHRKRYESKTGGE